MLMSQIGRMKIAVNVYILLIIILLAGATRAQEPEPPLYDLAQSLFISYNWDGLVPAINTIIQSAQSGNELPEAAQTLLEQANLGGVGQFAALLGRQLGGEAVDPMEIAAAAQQALTDMGQSGIGMLAEQAGLTLGGESTDWMAVADACQQVLSDMGLGGLGQLAELAGRSLGGENIDWTDIETAASQTLDDLNLGWLGDAVANISQSVGEFWYQNGMGGWSSLWSNIFGGICPTFIQPAAGAGSYNSIPFTLSQNLSAAICIPTDSCLLRSDIPIYGVAGGRQFDHYRVEFGRGTDPSTWFLIEESSIPKETFSRDEMPSLLQGDLDLRGNLATWNVGLKNWEHLPWHTALDTIDLNGVYTLRLLTFGRDGSQAEDRVICEVGRVIAQCLPGIAVSADEKVTMCFPEQSLPAAFRVYSIRRITDAIPPIPQTQRLRGDVYQIREGGDRFIKPVTLKMEVGSLNNNLQSLANCAIFTFDNSSQKWLKLPSNYDQQGSSLQTILTALPSPRALFAVLTLTNDETQSEPNIRPITSAESLVLKYSSTQEDTLIYNNFDIDQEQWTERDSWAGAKITWDCVFKQKGDCCLRISSKETRGNFSCGIISRKFDAQVFPVIEFDYCVENEFPIDLYAKIDGRWYNIGFSDEEEKFRYNDVGISRIGEIGDIKQDGQWHHVRVNLLQLLHTQTRNTIVDELILANWDVAGFMKLEFANTSIYSSLLIDNFVIHKDNRQLSPLVQEDSIQIDSFDSQMNMLGRERRTFTSYPRNTSSLQLVPRQTKTDANDYVLRFDYDLIAENDYGGWYTSLGGFNMIGCTEIAFDFRYIGSDPGCLIGLKTTNGRECKVPIEPFITSKEADSWNLVRIPISVFGCHADLSQADNISASVESALGHSSGVIEFDNLRLIFGGEDYSPLIVDNFDLGCRSLNNLGNGRSTFVNGAAAINADIDDILSNAWDGSALRLAFGGQIGLDLGESGFSYAGWTTGLGGIDLRGYDRLTMAVRGQKGGESFNVYLDDGNRRGLINSSAYATIDTDWNTLDIPLTAFSDNNVDLSHIEQLQIVFEWREMSGVIWIDDILLIRDPGTSEISISDQGDYR